MDRIILGTVRTWGPVTVEEVSRLTGYELKSTKARLDDLLKRGLVCARTRDGILAAVNNPPDFAFFQGQASP